MCELFPNLYSGSSSDQHLTVVEFSGEGMKEKGQERQKEADPSVIFVLFLLSLDSP